MSRIKKERKRKFNYSITDNGKVKSMCKYERLRSNTDLHIKESSHLLNKYGVSNSTEQLNLLPFHGYEENEYFGDDSFDNHIPIKEIQNIVIEYLQFGFFPNSLLYRIKKENHGQKELEFLRSSSIIFANDLRLEHNKKLNRSYIFILYTNYYDLGLRTENGDEICLSQRFQFNRNYYEHYISNDYKYNSMLKFTITLKYNNINNMLEVLSYCNTIDRQISNVFSIPNDNYNVYLLMDSCDGKYPHLVYYSM